MLYLVIKYSQRIFFMGLCLTLSLAHAQTVTKDNQQVGSTPADKPIDIKKPTNSQKYLSLEFDTPEREQWILNQNHKVNQKINNSPNKKKVEKWLHDLYSKERIKLKKFLSNGSQIQIVSLGIEKLEELRLVTKDQVSKTLITTGQFSRKQLVHIVNAELSLDEKYLAYVLNEQGSFDQFKIGVYDLTEMLPLKSSTLMPTISPMVYWLGNSLFLQIRTEDQVNYNKYDVSNPQVPPISFSWGIWDGNSGYILASDGIKNYILTSTVSYELPLNTFYTEIIGISKNNIYLKKYVNASQSEVHRVSLPLQNSTLEPKKWLSLPEGVIKWAKFSNDTLFVRHTFGPEETLFVYNDNADLLAQVAIPTAASLVKASISEDQKKLTLQLQSKVVEASQFDYDLIEKKFSDSSEDITKKLFTVNGKEFESTITETTSADGKIIPMRITKLKNLNLDGNNPVYMDVYGGFGVEYNFYPIPNPIVTDFLLRGGITVDPAIRGGNEFGENWHQDAVKEKKINTFNDLTAVSRYLVSKKYTQPSKIIIRGGSNGGLTVAATAILNPNDFGLVIPINGVHDLLHKEVLDERFSRGWSYEYGDSSIEEDYKYLAAISPVEKGNEQENSPVFLILSGRQDSRVNPAHSYKLYSVIEEKYPDSVYLYSTNNSGHGNSNINYQDLIAWRVNVVIWTMIYDHLGWRF